MPVYAATAMIERVSGQAVGWPRAADDDTLQRAGHQACRCCDDIYAERKERKARRMHYREVK